MDTPFNITVASPSWIENQHARSIADVVANDPFRALHHLTGYMYCRTFRIRGIRCEPERDVSIDGLFGLVPSGHVPLEFIERVEVFKGAQRPVRRHGSSGAVGGTISTLAPKRGPATTR